MGRQEAVSPHSQGASMNCQRLQLASPGPLLAPQSHLRKFEASARPGILCVLPRPRPPAIPSHTLHTLWSAIVKPTEALCPSPELVVHGNGDGTGPVQSHNNPQAPREHQPVSLPLQAHPWEEDRVIQLQGPHSHLITAGPKLTRERIHTNSQALHCCFSAVAAILRE